MDIKKSVHSNPMNNDVPVIKKRKYANINFPKPLMLTKEPPPFEFKLT